MSLLSKIWSFNQQFVFGLCAVSMLYTPSQIFAQVDYDDNYAVEQPSGYSQPVLLGGAAVLGAAAGAITAACMNRSHHSHRGNRGERGPQGVPGTNGVIGVNGATGATGATGPAGGDPFIADPNPAATFTVDYEIVGAADPGITFTPFIIYPDGTVQDGLTFPVITSITTAIPLVYGSYTIGLRVLVPSNSLTSNGVVTPVVTASANGSTYQLPSYTINISGVNNSPGYMYTSQYEYPNPATPFFDPT